MLQEAVVLFLDTFQALQERTKEIKNVQNKLEVFTEIFQFCGNDDEDGKPIKEMSPHDQSQAVKVCSVFETAPGNTNDYTPMRAILNNLMKDGEEQEKIKNGEIRKIVIMMTDDKSANESSTREYTEKLREMGVIVIAIGMTKSGESVIERFGEDFARVAYGVEDIPVLLFELLKIYLEDL